MPKIDLTYQNFDSEISKWNKFITNERGNNLKVLIEKWNDYIDNSDDQDRNLEIRWVEFEDYVIDIRLKNISLGEFRFKNGIQWLYIYLHKSTIESMIFNDAQNEIGHKVLQWDWNSKINKLVFENIHFNDDKPSSLTIASIEIGSFQFLRSINLSEKVQILWCNIKKLFVVWSDLWSMLFNENIIKNLYVMTSAIYKTIFITNSLWKIRDTILKSDWLTPVDLKLDSMQMAWVFRQLKSTHDEWKNYVDWDRFYFSEMFYTLKSQYFLNPVFLLHLISSRFGTSWIQALLFIFLLWFWRLVFTESINNLSCVDIFTKTINNINPYTNLKEAGDIMSIQHFIYLLFLSYWVYQFILSVRRSSKR